MARATAVANVADRASAYAIPGVMVDGNDFAAVAEASFAAVERARAGEGPTLIEAKTYRTRGHSRSDRNRYRSREEIDEWRARDPIARFEAEIVALGIAPEARVAETRPRSKRKWPRLRPRRARAPGRRWPIWRDVYSPAEGAPLERPRAFLRRGDPRSARHRAERDERVFLMGEDIGVYGGAFQVTGDLVDRFGEERVMDTPISEMGGAGVAVGAALTGMRPVYEFQFSDFSMLAMEQIVNQAAKLRYMLGGAVSVPVVFRMPTGSGLGGAAQHSQSIEAWYAHVPGLKVVEPSTPQDVKGMLLAAIRDPDPVIVFEHKLLYKMQGVTPEARYTARSRDRPPLSPRFTIVATGIMVSRALEAAETSQGGIEAEVIDLRSLSPIDKGPIVESVEKTSRLMCVYEGVKTSASARKFRHVAESEAFDYLDAPIIRLGGADAPIPYSPVLEHAVVPQADDIVAAARRLGRARSDARRDRYAARRHGHGPGPAPLVRRRGSMAKGPTLFEIETDKAAMEVEAPASGVLKFVAASEGDVLPVGACIGWIVAEGEDFAPPANSRASASRAPPSSLGRPARTPVFRRAIAGAGRGGGSRGRQNA